MTEIMEQPTEEGADDSWVERCKECGSQMVETGRGDSPKTMTAMWTISTTNVRAAVTSSATYRKNGDGSE